MSWGNRKRKFSIGQVIGTLQGVIDAAGRCQYMYLGGKLQHPAVVMNQPLAHLCRLIEGCAVRLAVRDPSKPYVFKADGAVVGGYAASCSEIPDSLVSGETRGDLENCCRSRAKEWANSERIAYSAVIVEYAAERKVFTP